MEREGWTREADPMPGVERWRALEGTPLAGMMVESGKHPYTGQRRLVVVGAAERPTLQECQTVRDTFCPEPGVFAAVLPATEKPAERAPATAQAPQVPADSTEAVPPEIAALRAYQAEMLPLMPRTIVVQELLQLTAQPEQKVQVAPAGALSRLGLGAAQAGPQRPGPDHPAFRGRRR